MSLINEGKASIVSTLGPSSTEPEILEKMIESGLDVVRLNMSHGTHEEHKQRFEMVREVNDTIPILIDLSGPKIRIGKMKESVVLNAGQEIDLVRNEKIGTRTSISVSYPELIRLANPGNKLFLNDGIIELEVVEKTEDKLKCEVLAGGPLSSRKGLNAPGVPIQLYAPTDKDLEDIEATVDLKPDFYGVSFVRRPEDLQKVRNTISQYTTDLIPLVSKIEHQDALDNIDQIISITDSIMVARGDLGVELPPEDIPLIQEKLVRKCNKNSKPCIVATQMLESMTVSQKPTRAEASDVANAILQGADAVMLSAETATGKFPIESVKMMDKIINRVQHKVREKQLIHESMATDVAESVGKSAVSLADSINCDVIIAFTRSGKSSLAVSKFRPRQPIIAITPLVNTSRRIRLQWGVSPLLLKRDFTDTDEMIYQGIKLAFEKDYIKKYDTAVIVAGSLLGLPASTNLIHYVKIDEIINSVEAQQRFTQAYSLDPTLVNK